MSSENSTQRQQGDRRSAPRHLDRFYVRAIADDGQQSEVCELRNISTGGMAVAPPKQLPAEVGATLIVELPLGRSMSRLHTRCTVRERSEKEDAATLHLQFLDRSPIFVDTLEACIASWESRPQPDRRGDPQ